MELIYRRGLTRSLVIAVTALLAAAAFFVANPADAGSLEEVVSGSFTDTAIDLAPGGNAANLVSGATTGGGGATYEGIWEIELTFVQGSCDQGEIEGTAEAYSIVRRYPNGDLLFSKLDAANPGTTCFNPGAGTAELSFNAVITGGTGRFAGATGSYTADYDVVGLVPDPGGGIAHGAFSGTISS